ncbi:TPA: type-F conjugative transfer system protein TrbI [Legionella pneumophila]|nr:type-F conjugative transfer system protein TrbI [Legionella pneumophila]HAU0349933.1 type-F conjugative transfer system protein TrbI [Legionella pneumophila]HAU0353424.1 type-F conjugative transfer system protein TrbI [Legionella pneumophila]HAU0359513.1 type-F conjugative transfer system protein TrbI [Legionella pneumophila]HAU0368070.1 type-F conjugative transfer system protein TrbI [Legionella pneumophila]
MLSHYKQYGFAFVIALLVIFGIWIIKTPPKFAVVDMQRLLNQPAALMSQSKLSQDEQKAVLQRYAEILPKVLTHYGQSHGLTLISATVITTGAADVTDEIIGLTLDKLRAV